MYAGNSSERAEFYHRAVCRPLFAYGRGDVGQEAYAEGPDEDLSARRATSSSTRRSRREKNSMARRVALAYPVVRRVRTNARPWTGTRRQSPVLANTTRALGPSARRLRRCTRLPLAGDTMGGYAPDWRNEPAARNSPRRGTNTIGPRRGPSLSSVAQRGAFRMTHGTR